MLTLVADGGLHVLYCRCRGWLKSLPQPLQLSHFITIVKILAAVRLGLRFVTFVGGTKKSNTCR